ncbi:DUF2807 domain-containing protein [Pseudonocardia sp.]|uniref:GIN domain-containing protein n=1 Tax=Pseudonocardia sp. TaxID=60912 RepID=UPI0026362951|nr:DUF2807 domain-containing protein [Pseudonocardia sp.]
MLGIRGVVGVLVAVVLSGCGATPTTGDAVPTTAPTTAATASDPGSGGEIRDVRGFTGVDLASVGELRIDQTGTESLSIQADADVLPLLTSEVSDGVLVLGVVPGSEIVDSGPIVYTLTVATLDSITVSGAGDATAANVATDRLTVELSGAGDVTASGAADAQSVTISGTGKYDGEDLQSATAEVDVNGAGSAVVRVSDRLDAAVGGVGSVEYIGDPQVTEDVSGVGSIQQR